MCLSMDTSKPQQLKTIKCKIFSSFIQKNIYIRLPQMPLSRLLMLSLGIACFFVHMIQSNTLYQCTQFDLVKSSIHRSRTNCRDIICPYKNSMHEFLSIVYRYASNQLHVDKTSNAFAILLCILNDNYSFRFFDKTTTLNNIMYQIISHHA